MSTRKKCADYEDIVKLQLANADWEDRTNTNWYRAMLDNIKKGESVESYSTQQNGTVKQIIRNRNGIPVCLKVRTDKGEMDYISVDRVSDWECTTRFVNPDEYSDWWRAGWQEVLEWEEDGEDD